MCVSVTGMIVNYALVGLLGLTIICTLGIITLGICHSCKTVDNSRSVCLSHDLSAMVTADKDTYTAQDCVKDCGINIDENHVPVLPPGHDGIDVYVQDIAVDHDQEEIKISVESDECEDANSLQPDGQKALDANSDVISDNKDLTDENELDETDQLLSKQDTLQLNVRDSIAPEVPEDDSSDEDIKDVKYKTYVLIDSQISDDDDIMNLKKSKLDGEVIVNCSEVNDSDDDWSLYNTRL